MATKGVQGVHGVEERVIWGLERQEWGSRVREKGGNGRWERQDWGSRGPQSQGKGEVWELGEVGWSGKRMEGGPGAWKRGSHPGKDDGALGNSGDGHLGGIQGGQVVEEGLVRGAGQDRAQVRDVCGDSAVTPGTGDTGRGGGGTPSLPWPRG